MRKYVWSIDNQVWPDAEPLIVKRGELVEVSMKNATPMIHPMHLHGHFFRLVLPGIDSRFAALKHTVNVAPDETVRFVSSSWPTTRGAGSSAATTATT